MQIEVVEVMYRGSPIKLSCEFEVVDDEDFGPIIMLNSWNPNLDTRVSGWLENATEQLTNKHC